MYIPPHFVTHSTSDITAVIQNNNFGILVSNGPDGLLSTHLPFLYDPTTSKNGTLRAHLARANPHAKLLATGGEAMVIFHGPHAYVSPILYETPGVPTWNYVAVHAYGIPRMIDDNDALWNIVAALSEQHEAANPTPWKPAENRGRFEPLLSAIVGFEIEITRLDAKFKLSQNRSVDDQQRIAEKLSGSPYETERDVAAMMNENINRE